MGNGQAVGGAAKRKSIIQSVGGKGPRHDRAASSDDDNPGNVGVDAGSRLSRAPATLSFSEDESIAPPSAAVACAIAIFAVRGVDQKVHTLSFDANKNKFSRWEIVDVAAYSGATAASSADCHFDLIVRSAASSLMYCACEGGVWSTWLEIPGQCASTASACSVAPDTLEVFAAAPDAELMWRRQNVGRWTDWRKIPARLFSSPFAVAVSQRIEIFARSEHDTLLWLRSDDQGWSKWVDLGGVVVSSPRACLGLDGDSLYVFVRGAGNRCYSIARDIQQDRWGEWTSLGGVHASAVACVAVSGSGISAIFLMSANPAGNPQVCRLLGGNESGGWKIVPGCIMF